MWIDPDGAAGEITSALIGLLPAPPSSTDLIRSYTCAMFWSGGALAAGFGTRRPYQPTQQRFQLITFTC
jgi:hypothetical protein